MKVVNAINKGFWIVPVNPMGIERPTRHWTAVLSRAHRYAQLDSEEYGAAYIQECDVRSTGPYWRIMALYRHGVPVPIAVGQLWLKLGAPEVPAVPVLKVLEKEAA
jgi:hypothetical protein